MILGRLGQLKRLGDSAKRIVEAKKKLGEMKKLVTSGIDVKEWFFKIAVKMEKDSFTALLQNRLSKVDTFKRATTERRAQYFTIVYDTIQDWPSEKINPKDAIDIAKLIEKKLNEYDSKNPNQN